MSLFDFEWSSSNGPSEHATTSIDNRITAFVDSHGNRTVLRLSDSSTSNNSEADLYPKPSLTPFIFGHNNKCFRFRIIYWPRQFTVM
ncbi:hypothetical protein BH18THE2_BH18THE2_41260 [soil metagenome]